MRNPDQKLVFDAVSGELFTTFHGRPETTVGCLEFDPELAREIAKRFNEAAYRVHISKVTTQTNDVYTGTRYEVHIDQGTRPPLSLPTAPGRITPCRAETHQHANHEAAKWAGFLGVSFTPRRG